MKLGESSGHSDGVSTLRSYQFRSFPQEDFIVLIKSKFITSEMLAPMISSAKSKKPVKERQILVSTKGFFD